MFLRLMEVELLYVFNQEEQKPKSKAYEKENSHVLCYASNQ